MRQVVERNVIGIQKLLAGGADPGVAMQLAKRHTPRKRGFVQPVFAEFQSLPVCLKTCALLQAAQHWSVASHFLFPRPFRSAVKHILGLQNSMATVRLETDIWLRIISNLPRTFSLSAPEITLNQEDFVLISGLQSQSGLNGQCGTVLRWIPQTERYEIALPRRTFSQSGMRTPSVP